MRLISRNRIAIRGLGAVCILIALAGLAPNPASAAIFTLIDDNSVAQFDTATQSNNFNWLVNGTDYLAQQAFWYRLGGAAPESSIHTLPIGVQGTSDSNFDGNPDTLFVRYNGPGFQVEVNYKLDGGTPASASSDLTEQIAIKNVVDVPLDFHFFQYVDFDLSQPASDTLLFTNANTVEQFGGTAHLSETVVTPVASHHQGSFFPVLINAMIDAAPTTLNDTPPIGVPLGPGDMNWAYEWDATIPVGGTFQISKDKSLNANVPEPTAAAAILLAASAGLLNRRRKAMI